MGSRPEVDLDHRFEFRLDVRSTVATHTCHFVGFGHMNMESANQLRNICVQFLPVWLGSKRVSGRKNADSMLMPQDFFAGVNLSSVHRDEANRFTGRGCTQRVELRIYDGSCFLGLPSEE